MSWGEQPPWAWRALPPSSLPTTSHKYVWHKVRTVPTCIAYLVRCQMRSRVVPCVCGFLALLLFVCGFLAFLPCVCGSLAL